MSMCVCNVLMWIFNGLSGFSCYLSGPHILYCVERVACSKSEKYQRWIFALKSQLLGSVATINVIDKGPNSVSLRLQSI